MELEKHYINRSNWLRAAVLGANDGIISTSSLAIGVAAAATSRENLIIAVIAGVFAGAFSMAAGEYVSVSSQADLEKADLKREKEELDRIPEIELIELAKIYEGRGLDKKLAMQVANKLTEHDALNAHARDELGINNITEAKPFQAAMASGASFIFGAALPLSLAYIAPMGEMIGLQYVFAILFLAISGFISAKIGGSPIWKAVIRICFWGTVAMGMTALIGYLFGLQ